jgi:hypothetical protein
MTVSWGLLGPEKLGIERRTRTLGLGATVRTFNDLAVPGLGGAWFGKQLFLAVLGVAVAERTRRAGKRLRNIEVTNAVEALACCLALLQNNWQRDARLRGQTKLQGTTDFSFVHMRRPGTYVTQPMRQATVQPLRALGFVESAGERFNAFACAELGLEFIETVCAGCSPYNRSVLDHLSLWATGADDRVRNSEALVEALSPLRLMPQNARELLRERIVQGSGTDANRRRSALDWVQFLRSQLDRQVVWHDKPPMLSDEHWKDLHSGALFFKTRDAAIALLDHIEAHIDTQSVQKLSLDKPLPSPIVAKIRSLQEHGQAFLDNKYDPSPGVEASVFCRQCTERDDARVLEHLLVREGRVLRQFGRDIVPGAAFRGSQMIQLDVALNSKAARSPEEAGAEKDVEKTIPLPDGISQRVFNLFLLNVDLHGDLEDWLGT